jgi:Ca-activated chloride channel family protein
MKAKPTLIIIGLIGITAVAMTLAASMNAAPLSKVIKLNSNEPALSGEVRLIQPKVLKNGDGTVAVEVTLTSEPLNLSDEKLKRPVDLTVVLDRSGSMQGEKMSHALNALQQLLSDLGETDRLALVSYSNGATVHCGLTPMSPDNRRQIAATIAGVSVGGGTNLGAGLLAGLNLMPSKPNEFSIRHLLVISDGLVNQGLTDPNGLGQIIADMGRRGISVGTVGVGSDFNEQLMAFLADRGQGRYYYLENPTAFAGLFKEAYRNLRAIAATDVRIQIDTDPKVRLVDAAGYPIEQNDGVLQIRPGNIKTGDTRTLYLTFHVPTHQIGTISLGRLELSYLYNGNTYHTKLGPELTLACVKNQKDVWASIEKERWTQKVLKNDYNQLKREVAQDIAQGDENRAIKRIESYRNRQAKINAVIRSEEVDANLKHELKDLNEQVGETFAGAPEQVQLKQKNVSKSLHYDGYKGQRSVK